MTPSDVIAARAAGFTELKLFPAQQAGGIGMLKALAGPFPDVSFCPTGGVSAATAPEFLALPNVVCVGGSWLTPADAVARATGTASRRWRGPHRSWAPCATGDRERRWQRAALLRPLRAEGNDACEGFTPSARSPRSLVPFTASR